MDKELKLQDYIAIARRRKLYLIIPALIIPIVGAAVAFALPSVYRSTGKILVESQQIPADLVKSTVTGLADQRIGLTQQRIMTRKRLEDIIAKFRLYRDKVDWSKAKVLNKLRQDISVKVINDPYHRAGTIAFTVSFDYNDPETAHAVADYLVHLFLRENVVTRTARATETTDFLKDQAEKLAAQASAIEAKVARFKQEHSDTLPENLSLKVTMLDRAESNLKGLERDIATAEEEMRFLETQRDSVTAVYSRSLASDAAPLSPKQQLAALRAELVQKLGVYTPNHPDIVSLKRRIADLAKSVKDAERGLNRDTKLEDPAMAEINSRIRSANVRLDSMRAQKKDLEETVARLQAQVTATPENERKLKDLTRDYDNARSAYQTMLSKVQEAQLGQTLENEKKAERFELLESPIVPVSPVAPNKLKILMLAFVLGLGAGGGAAFGAEMLDSTVRDPAMLTDIIGRHPIAVIPHIDTLHSDGASKQTRRFWYGAGTAILVVTLMGGLFVFYLSRQPLGATLRSLTFG